MRAPIAALLLAAAAVPAAAQTSRFEALRSGALAPGQWSYARTAEGSAARFGTLFTVRCLAASRLVVLRRLDAVASAPVIIVTDMLARALPPSGTLGATDPLLDAIAFSRGQIIVTGEGAATLVIPAAPEAARSIEDCRN